MKSTRVSTRRVQTGAVAALMLLAGLVGGCGSTDEAATIERRSPSASVPAPGPAADAATTTTQPPPVGPTSNEPAPEPSPAPGPVAGDKASPAVAEPVSEDPRPGAGSVTSHGGPVRDHVSLVDNLRARGLTVNPSSVVDQPFLSAPGTILDISGAGIGGASLQSFDYQTPEAAAADMAVVTGRGGDGQVVSIMWMGTPHFFLRERAFVIYVGSDGAVVNLLTDLLGPEADRG